MSVYGKITLDDFLTLFAGELGSVQGIKVVPSPFKTSEAKSPVYVQVFDYVSDISGVDEEEYDVEDENNDENRREALSCCARIPNAHNLVANIMHNVVYEGRRVKVVLVSENIPTVANTRCSKVRNMCCDPDFEYKMPFYAEGILSNIRPSVDQEGKIVVKTSVFKSTFRVGDKNVTIVMSTIPNRNLCNCVVVDASDDGVVEVKHSSYETVQDFVKLVLLPNMYAQYGFPAESYCKVINDSLANYIGTLFKLCINVVFNRNRYENFSSTKKGVNSNTGYKNTYTAMGALEKFCREESINLVTKLRSGIDTLASQGSLTVPTADIAKVRAVRRNVRNAPVMPVGSPPADVREGVQSIMRNSYPNASSVPVRSSPPVVYSSPRTPPRVPTRTTVPRMTVVASPPRSTPPSASPPRSSPPVYSAPISASPARSAMSSTPVAPQEEQDLFGNFPEASPEDMPQSFDDNPEDNFNFNDGIDAEEDIAGNF